MIRPIRLAAILFALLFLLAPAAWADISLELDPQQPEQGQEFDFALVVPASELPEAFNFPELEFAPGVLEVLATGSSDDVRRDFFFGRYKVKRFAFRMKALRDGAHQVAIWWTVGGTRRAIGSARVVVRRNLDAPGMGAHVAVDRRRLWEGEQFALTVQLNAYQNFVRLESASSLDFGAGIWGAVDEKESFAFERAKGAGDVVAVAKVRAFLAPVRAGRVEIPPLKFRYLKSGRPQRKVEEKKIGGMTMRSESVTQEPQEAYASSAPVVLDVRPLPEEGRPAHFSGLVGRYSLSAKLSAESARLGSPVTLEVTVVGDGRPGATPKLRLPDLSEFRSVPPEEKTTVALVKGRKQTTWRGKWFLYPRRPGRFEIGPVAFSYFDAKSGSYRTLESETFPLEVSRSADGTDAAAVEAVPSPAAGPGPAPAPAQRREIEALGSDIRYISADASGLSDRAAFAYRSPLYWILAALALLLPAFALLARSLFRKVFSDPGRLRRSRARSAAHAKLGEARAALRDGDAHRFCDALERALFEALGEALNRSPRGMRRSEIADGVVARGLSAEEADGLLALLSACDLARYGGGGWTAEKGRADLASAEKLLEALWRARP